MMTLTELTKKGTLLFIHENENEKFEFFNLNNNFYYIHNYSEFKPVQENEILSLLLQHCHSIQRLTDTPLHLIFSSITLLHTYFDVKNPTRNYYRYQFIHDHIRYLFSYKNNSDLPILLDLSTETIKNNTFGLTVLI